MHAIASRRVDNGSLDYYESEVARTSSYSSHLSRFQNHSIITLARDGFYNTEHASEIQCYSCGYKFNFDNDIGDPIENHRRHIPLCEHVKFQNTSNGFNVRSSALRPSHANPLSTRRQQFFSNGTQLQEEIDQHHTPVNRDSRARAIRQQRTAEQADGEPSSLSGTFNRQIKINQQPTSTRPNQRRNDKVISNVSRSGSGASGTPSSVYIPFTDHRLERCRLQSFDRWPSNATAVPSELVNAGFFYLGIDDKVECAFCKGVLRCWEPGDKPLAEHLRHFPHCAFLLDPVGVGNVPIGEEDQARVATVQMRNTASDVSSLSGVLMDRPINPRFANVGERLSSFSNYPSNSFQQPKTLAHAGFFYTGQIDAVRCFFCNVLLKNWQKHTDPWVEHVKASSKCGYTLMNKGEDFVKRVLQNKHNKPRHGNPNKQRPQKVAKYKVKETDLDRMMTSSMVTSVIAMGSHSEDLVKAVIKHRLEELGEQFPNAEALGDGISDYLEYMENNYDSDTEETANEFNHPAPTSNQDRERNASPVADPDDIFESSKDSFVCKVCLDNTASIVFLKCGHLVCCNTCAPELTKCPICREQIMGTICVDM